jgi:hypothetical protein
MSEPATTTRNEPPYCRLDHHLGILCDDDNNDDNDSNDNNDNNDKDQLYCRLFFCNDNKLLFSARWPDLI